MLLRLPSDTENSAADGSHSHRPSSIFTTLPGAILKPRPERDGVTLTCRSLTGRYEFHMHYHPPEDWRCRCHVKERIRFPARGPSHFAPDDFVSWHPKEPLEFKDWPAAQRWWNQNGKRLVKSIHEQSWERTKPTRALVETIKKRGLHFALYVDGDDVWVDVFEKLHCGHWICTDTEQRQTFPNVAAAKDALRWQIGRIKAETSTPIVAGRIWRSLFRSNSR